MSRQFPWKHKESDLNLEAISELSRLAHNKKGYHDKYGTICVEAHDLPSHVQDALDRIRQLEAELETAKAAYFSMREKLILDRIEAVDKLIALSQIVLHRPNTFFDQMDLLAEDAQEWIKERIKEGWK